MVLLALNKPFAKKVSKRILGTFFNYIEIEPKNLLFIPLLKNLKEYRKLKNPRRIYYRIPGTSIYFFKQLASGSKYFLPGNFYIKEYHLNLRDVVIPSVISFTFLLKKEWSLEKRSEISSKKKKVLDYFKDNLF